MAGDDKTKEKQYMFTLPSGKRYNVFGEEIKTRYTAGDEDDPLSSMKKWDWLLVTFAAFRTLGPIMLLFIGFLYGITWLLFLR